MRPDLRSPHGPTGRSTSVSTPSPVMRPAAMTGCRLLAIGCDATGGREATPLRLKGSRQPYGKQEEQSTPSGHLAEHLSRFGYNAPRGRDDSIHVRHRRHRNYCPGKRGRSSLRMSWAKPPVTANHNRSRQP